MKRDYNSAQLGGPVNMRSRLNDFSAPYHPMANNKPSKQLMSFQNYVRTLNNNVDENTAYKKYKDFMANLSQSKVGRFFDANKDREWFRLKYHPIEGQKTLYQQSAGFQRRLKIFYELHDKNYFDKLPYTSTNPNAILNFLDAVIVYLEDGPQELVEQLLSLEESKVDSFQRAKYVPIKPTSVVITDLNIETTYAEIREVCLQGDSGLLRIAQLDPYYVEGGNLKRKVVAVYNDAVDIREVCWRLSRLQLNNRSLNVYINKCLTERVHSVEAISNHYISVVNDIRNAINLILNFDELRGLSGKRKQSLEINVKEEPMDAEMDTEVDVQVKSEPLKENNTTIDNFAPLSPPGSEKSVVEEDGEKPFDVSTLDEDKEKERKKLLEFKFNIDLSLYRIVSKLNKSKNPILKGAHQYLIEFIESASAKYYLSKVPKEVQQEQTCLDLDENDTNRFSTIDLVVKNLPSSLEESTKFLDRLLWYLRIVHSFDYYKKAMYRKEDALTLRLGVIHLRDNPINMPNDVSDSAIREYLQQSQHGLEEFGLSQAQKYLTKDEERFNYKSYGKVITDELASYSQRIQKPKSNETEEVYKCKHCTRVFQKLTDIGRHFVGKHRWAIDTIELETDFFNAYLFDPTKIDPCPPRELLEVPPNRFAKLTTFSLMGEDPDLLQQTIEAYNKLESFVREPAPRAQVDSDPRNDSIVDYTDISFDDAI